jgi:hypothetical protein
LLFFLLLCWLRVHCGIYPLALYQLINC